MKFNNCLFHDNGGPGLLGYESIIHLHGEATAIHSNGGCGIGAFNSAQVIIHLSSNHNTFYNNGEEEGYSHDRHAEGGGTITNVDD